MIFQYTWENVVSGRKTETRRIAKPSETAIYDEADNIVAVEVNGRTKWQVGKTYSVQPGRTKSAIARIKLAGILHETLSDVTDAGAQAEGYTNRAEFIQAWRTVHGEGKEGVKVWVLQFELVP